MSMFHSSSSPEKTTKERKPNQIHNILLGAILSGLLSVYVVLQGVKIV
jgi:hypothetical protein